MEINPKVNRGFYVLSSHNILHFLSLPDQGFSSENIKFFVVLQILMCEPYKFPYSHVNVGHNNYNDNMSMLLLFL